MNRGGAAQTPEDALRAHIAARRELERVLDAGGALPPHPDALLPVTGATHLHENIAGSRVVIFEQSGHCPFIEEKGRFNDAVTEFLSSLPAWRS